MVTITQLLSYPIFGRFELISNKTGLHNHVTGTGLFEWESKEDIEATFSSGEFVLTTLYSAKSNLPRTTDALRALIDKGVSAIAIKLVHHNHIPSEIISYANAKHIPIYTFSETYIDDLIYCIKNILNADKSNNFALHKVKRLATEPDRYNIRSLAKDLNPYFYETCVCCCIIPRDPNESLILLTQYFSEYQRLAKNPALFNAASCSLIKCTQSFILVYTSSQQNESIETELDEFLQYFQDFDKSMYIGIGGVKTDLVDLQDSLLESTFAAITAALDNVSRTCFSENGINRILVPSCNSHWALAFYNEFHDILTQYDEAHNTNFHKTLLLYIYSDGDITLTANRLFQHINTIRYRLGKIKDLLGIRDSADAYIQMYSYVRIYDSLKVINTYNFDYLI